MKLGLFRQTETIKPEAELEDDGSESAFEASVARVNAFNEAAMEKAKTPFARFLQMGREPATTGTYIVALVCIMIGYGIAGLVFAFIVR